MISKVLQSAPTRVIDIQRGFREIGSIRMGYSEPRGQGKIPKRSDTWILTSNDKNALIVAAGQFGGEVQEWKDDTSKHAYRLITRQRELPVMISPIAAATSYELWQGGECKRRCNGEYDRLNGCPCQCPGDVHERANLAKNGKACKLATRVGFIMPSIPDLGVWGYVSHGYYAALELPNTTDFLRAMAVMGAKIPATLAIEIRKNRSAGTSKIYPVPVVRLAQSMNEIAALPQGPQALTNSAPQLAQSNPDGYNGPVVHEDSLAI
jgi:hypothetical protein